jgi:hypothetical protein
MIVLRAHGARPFIDVRVHLDDLRVAAAPNRSIGP